MAGRSSAARGVFVVAWTVACGPSVGVSAVGGSESTASSGDASSPTTTSGPSASESTAADSVDASTGDTTGPLDTGVGASSETTGRGDFDQCAQCGPDEVCLERVTDNCSPWELPCRPVPPECEVVTCDDPDCAQALCGGGFDCIGYGAPSCYGDAVSDGFVCNSRNTGNECDQWNQDCMDGQKCNAWSDDNDVYDHARCIPIARMPIAVGEACTVEDYALSGLDDCAFGAQCVDVDPETLVGVCRALCIGTRGNPSCAEPGLTCMVENGYGWCRP